MEKGFPIFLAHVTTKEVEDKSEKKRLEDVPIVQDFPEVFPEDLMGLPPTRHVAFQLISTLGPHLWHGTLSIGPSEMKESGCHQLRFEKKDIEDCLQNCLAITKLHVMPVVDKRTAVVLDLMNRPILNIKEVKSLRSPTEIRQFFRSLLVHNPVALPEGSEVISSPTAMLQRRFGRYVDAKRKKQLEEQKLDPRAIMEPCASMAGAGTLLWGEILRTVICSGDKVMLKVCLGKGLYVWPRGELKPLGMLDLFKVMERVGGSCLQLELPKSWQSSK
ncbi:hypothetical protein Tco_0411792 [Tanacetum coccineum]